MGAGDLADLAIKAAGAFGAAAGGWMLARRKFSQDAVALAGDAADVGSIKRLQEMLDRAEQARATAEKRADDFAEQRNQLVLQMGELKGQLASLTDQVKSLTDEVQRLRTRTERSTP